MKISLIPVYLLTYLLTYVICDSESEQDFNNPEVFRNIMGLRVRTLRDIQVAKELIDHPLLFFHYKESSRPSIEAGYYLKEVLPKFNHLIQVILIDCDLLEPSEYEYCQGDNFPKISLGNPPEIRFDVFTKTLNTHKDVAWTGGEITEKSIYDFAIRDYPSRVIKITRKNLNSFMDNDIFNKVILFTDKKTVPLIFKGISLEYHEKLLFGIFIL